MEELKEGWRRIKLEKLGEIISGGTPKTSIDKYWNGNIIWLTPKDFSNEKIKYWSVGERNITEEGLKNSSAKLMPKGTVLFTSRAPIGYVGIANTEVSTNQGFKNIIVNKENSNEFVYYLLKYITPHIESIAGGSTFKEISASIFKNIEVEVPNLEIQEKIASILSTLDDKIEINNEMNKTLEEMAQTLFKRWFIDFDFPNENGEPYKSSGGKMVDSELGEIPEGWETKKLNEVCNIEKGLSYKGKHLCEKGVPMVNLGSVRPGGGYREDKIKYYNGDFKLKNTVKSGDIIIANTDMTQERIILGSPFIVPKFLGNTVIFTHHLYSITNIKLPPTFLYCYFQEKKFRDMCESCATGTTVLALPKNDIINISIIVPKGEVLNNFGNIAKNIFELMELRLEEGRKITQSRDILLSKLMSGEIDI